MRPPATPGVSKMRLFRALSGVAAVLAIAACVGPFATRGLTTKADTRTRMGPPTDVHIDSHGREVWEYAEGRLGRGTTMIRFGPDGRVEEIRAALRSASVEKVVARQSTQANVRELLGMPSDIRIFPATDSEVWVYRILDEASRRVSLKIEFDGTGVVREVARLIEDEGSASANGSKN